MHLTASSHLPARRVCCSQLAAHSLLLTAYHVITPHTFMLAPHLIATHLPHTNHPHTPHTCHCTRLPHTSPITLITHHTPHPSYTSPITALTHHTPHPSHPSPIIHLTHHTPHPSYTSPIIHLTSHFVMAAGLCGQWFLLLQCHRECRRKCDGLRHRCAQWPRRRRV
jgi:hypothetical protein